MRPIYTVRGAGSVISFDQFRTALKYMTELSNDTKIELEIEKLEKMKNEITTKCVARSRAF